MRETKIIWYEWSLTCWHVGSVEVDAETLEPQDGAYVCPECGAIESVPTTIPEWAWR